MLALLTAVALSQTPVALVQSSNFGVQPQRIAELTRALSEVIEAAKLVPVAATAPCDKRACIFTTARQLKAGVVISLAFASLGKDTLVDAEALDVNDEKSLAQATLKAPGAASLQAGETSKFVAALKDAIAALAPAEKPTAVVIEPHKDVVVPPLVDQTEPKPPEASTGHSHVASFILGGLGIASAAIAIAFGVMGDGYKGQWCDTYTLPSGDHLACNDPDFLKKANTSTSTLLYSKGQQLNGAMNTDYMVANTAYVAAGVLLGTATLLFILSQ